MFATILLVILVVLMVAGVLGGIMVGAYHFGWKHGFMFCDDLYNPHVSRETLKEKITA